MKEENNKEFEKKNGRTFFEKAIELHFSILLKHNASLCIYCGQILAALKMPGGQLPWDTDVDAPMFATEFYSVLDEIIPDRVRKNNYSF